MTSAAFRDVAPTPNSLTQIGDGFSNLIGPKLQSFVVDANVGKLELRFSEAVDLDSVDITKLILQVSERSDRALRNTRVQPIHY